MKISILLMLVACVAIWDASAKPGADEALTILTEGNTRFVNGQVTHPDSNKDRRDLAAKSDQGNFALATVISCSDSRVPVETIFDTGIMDVFVVRVAGNVCATDEIGSIEYGVCHVNTPLLVVLGHTQCGAVTAVAKGLKGEGHALEKNIPPLVKPIIPAVQKVNEAFPSASFENLVNRAIEMNVWMGVENILMKSGAVREKVQSGKVKIVGAIYDLSTGSVKWLPETKCAEILKDVEANPNREKEAMAEDSGHSSHVTTPASEHAPSNEASTTAHH